MIGLIKRREFVITLFLWVSLLFIFANPGFFHLPSPGIFINQLSVEISLFIPLSILAGYAISEILVNIDKVLPTRYKYSQRIVLVAVSVSSVLIGAGRLLPTLNPVTFLVRESDRVAIDWLDRNIPKNEIIVINPTKWGYGLYMGQDGGYWISPLTGNATMPPNVLYGMSVSEKERVNHFVEELLLVCDNPEEMWSLLNRFEYSFVFIGSRGGSISPMALSDSDYFKTQYQSGSTWLFEAVANP
jgi:hypothetical protein